MSRCLAIGVSIIVLAFADSAGASEPDFELSSFISTNVWLPDTAAQQMVDLRGVLRLARQSSPGRHLQPLFSQARKGFRDGGYQRIASAFGRTAPVIRELARAESRADVNLTRARRASRRVLRAALAIQPIKLPSGFVGFSEGRVPFYTLIALNYGAQLRRAVRNVARSRPATAGLGKSASGIWLEAGTNNQVNVRGLKVPRSYNYILGNTLFSGRQPYPKVLAVTIPGYRSGPSHFDFSSGISTGSISGSSATLGLIVTGQGSAPLSGSVSDINWSGSTGALSSPAEILSSTPPASSRSPLTPQFLTMR